MPGLLIIVALFGLHVRAHDPPAARQGAGSSSGCSARSRLGDEVLTVGGIYGIVQELEPDEDGGDLIVEIADGIHVRVARKALATVVKPDERRGRRGRRRDDGDDESSTARPKSSTMQPNWRRAGVEEVNGEEESVNPGAAEGTAPPERS